MKDMIIITNNVPRPTLSGHDLNKKELEEFDYIDDIENCIARFVRYKGITYDLHEFDSNCRLLPDEHPFRKWDGFRSDSFYTGVLVKFCDDYEYVIMATSII